MGNTLVLSGTSVPNGTTAVPLPAGSFALFTDVTGDVILFLPTLTLVLDGQTGRLALLTAR